MDGVCKDFTPGDCDVTAKQDKIEGMLGKRVQVRVCYHNLYTSITSELSSLIIYHTLLLLTACA